MQTEKKITVSDGYIEIHVTKHFIYDICLEDAVKDHKTGRMNWLEHLKAKNWFDPATEKRFIEIVKLNCPELLETA